jgi:hypothetical protein
MISTEPGASRPSRYAIANLLGVLGNVLSLPAGCEWRHTPAC